MFAVIDKTLFTEIRRLSANRSVRQISIELERKGQPLGNTLEESDERVKEILNAKDYEAYCALFETTT